MTKIMQKNAGIFQAIVSSSTKSLIVIFILTLLAYGNIFLNNFFMDDFSFVVNWPLIQNLGNLPRFFFHYIPPEAQGGIYSPLRTLLFALNYAAWKLNPAGYHLFSSLVNFAGIFFVYRIALLLTRNYLVAFLTALFFGVHPVHDESVATITGSVDTFGVVLLFAAFYYYIKATGYQGSLVQNDQKFSAPISEVTASDATGSARGVMQYLPVVMPRASGDPKGRPLTEQGKIATKIFGAEKRAYVLSVVLALLAIFTHELALMLPFLFIFYDCLFRGGTASRRDVLLRNLPFFAIGLIYVVLKGLVLGAVSRGHYLFHSFYLSLLVVIKVLAKFVVMSFFPLVLTHDPVISPGIFAFNEKDFDPHAVLSQSFWDGQVLLSLAFLLGIAVVAFKTYRKQPLVSFCIGWFFICLLPVMQIVPSSVFFAERYLYPGSFTACLLLAYFIYRLYIMNSQASTPISQIQEKRFLRTPQTFSIYLAVAITLFFTVRTFLRTFDGRNEVTVYRSAVKANPYSAALWNDLGVVYMGYEDYDLAIESMSKAIAIKPKEPHYYLSLAEAYFRAQQPEKAIKNLDKVIELNSDYAEAYYNLASIYGYQGDKVKSLEYLNKAIATYRKQGRILEAGEYADMLLKSLNRPGPRNADEGSTSKE